EKYQRDRWQEAVADFERATNLEPQQFWPRYFLAVCKLRQPDYVAARDELDLLLRQHPKFAWGYVMRGFAEQQQEKPDYRAAESDYRRAEELERADPDPEARYALFVNRGVLYLAQG